MKTSIHNLTAYPLRGLLREYRNTNPNDAQISSLGNSAAIGKLSTSELRQWCERLGITEGEETRETLELETVKPSVTPTAGELIAQALAMMQPHQPPPPAMDEELVREIVSDQLAKQLPRTVTVEITRGGEVVHTSGAQHYLFPLVVKLANSGVPVMLCGPAGSGKTTLAHNVAKALSRPFEFNSYGPGMSEAKLLGYRDAGGNYHDTALIRMAKAGGLYLADELDRADGAIVTTLNSLLANGQVSAPCGVFEKHQNFAFIAGTNTAGTGADALYTAAQEQDASLLDRLFFLPMPYDPSLEETACGINLTPQKDCQIDSGGTVIAEKWVQAVRAARAKCQANQMRHTISPRASILGSRLLSAGVGVDWLIPGLLTRGLPDDEAKQIATAARESLKA